MVPAARPGAVVVWLRLCDRAVEHRWGNGGVGVPHDELGHPVEPDRLCADADPALHRLPHLVRMLPGRLLLHFCCFGAAAASAACTVTASGLQEHHRHVHHRKAEK